MQCLSSSEENHSTSVAHLDSNKKYNRFLNIVPCESNHTYTCVYIVVFNVGWSLVWECSDVFHNPHHV